MTISAKAGNLDNLETAGRLIDWLELQWHETNKRILNKKTKLGVDCTLRFLDEDPTFTEGDILFNDQDKIIAIQILPCDAIVLAPRNMYEMAAICYETGNRHLPLFYDNNELLMPFDAPFYRLMNSFGYEIKREERKLLYPLKTSVKPHDDVRIDFSRMQKVAIQK